MSPHKEKKEERCIKCREGIGKTMKQSKGGKKTKNIKNTAEKIVEYVRQTLKDKKPAVPAVTELLLNLIKKETEELTSEIEHIKGEYEEMINS